MLRADNVICATSSTGAGTLNLAACPAPPGGLDFDKWLKATGIGFVSGNALVVSYTIIEYTSAAFTTVKQTEKGVGTLTLGTAIGGGTPATLARTVVQSKVTGLDTATPSPTYSAPTAITIGTAANTLVFVGASAADVLAFNSSMAIARTSNGFPPLMCGNPTFNGGAGIVNNQNWTWPFIWAATMLVKRVWFRVESPYSGAVNNLYARMYQENTAGEAAKLLYDFGVVGTANDSFNVGAFTMIASAAGAGNGFLLTPGEYFLQICPIWTVGGVGTPTLTQWAVSNAPLTSGFRGAGGVQPNFTIYDNSPSAVAADPAPTGLGQVSAWPVFFLGP